MRQVLGALFILLTLGFAASAGADERAGLPMEYFSKIPVQHEGRVKPMARFAAIELGRLSHGDSREKPLHWLATALFNPQKGASLPVIKVANRDLILRAGLPARRSGLYSLEELAPFLEKTQEQALSMAAAENKVLSPEDEALLALHEKALGYNQILGALTLFLPLEASVPPVLDVKAGVFDDHPAWLEIRKREQALADQLGALMAAKGEAFEAYTDEEKALARLGFAYRSVQEAGARNAFFRLFPPQWQNSQSAQGDETWLSPWALLQSGGGSPQTAELMQTWQALARAYYNGDQQSWAQESQKAATLALALNGDERLAARLGWEMLYSRTAPLKLAFGFYGLALGLLLGGWWIREKTVAKGMGKILRRGAVVSAVAGSVAHIAGNGMRLLILGRPPVGSLHETLLFVSMIIVTFALFTAWRRRDNLALGAGCFAALAILALAPTLAPGGDDLTVLVAVLNTNFWLATHVVFVTIGYGVSILGSVMAHLYLFARRRKAERQGTRDGLYRTVYILALGALFFTAFGTVLGGIWADQSWGRFWGWDPKENGALLIVLWLVWLLHGRLGGHLSPVLFGVGIAFLNVVVALSWFGVNLLNVGLHSYGFTSGLAWGLGLFCTMEAVLIAALYLLTRRTNLASKEAYADAG